MLAEFRMELETDSAEFSYYQSSNMQGVLMEQINPLYGEKLHEQGLNPYSQHLEFGKKIYWVINTLDKEAYQEIILPWLDGNHNEFVIKKKDIKLKILHKEIKTVKKQELLDNFYQKPCERYLNLEFLTPTSFKSDGNYMIFPDLRLIYQSLMNKYSASSPEMEMFDKDVLEELVKQSSITGYRLNSTQFPMEGIKIPSFKGKLGIKIKGTETLAKYARFLAEFGEYSGIGIKTSIGMGALRIEDRRNR